MIEGRRILAVVPARSGSKGIPDKNMRKVGGSSLIARAGDVLSACPFVDARVLSTDSERFAAEGRRHGLDTPFVRPAELATDAAGAVETMQHALRESELYFEAVFDLLLIVEPTSPLRTAADLERATRLLVATGADSVVTVSTLSAKFHPRKLLTVDDGHLGFYLESGATVTGRQQLSGSFAYRNGVCYALTRACLMDRKAIITENTIADVIDRPVVNIDEPIELVWAEHLLRLAETTEGGSL
jgi:CMP-N-acetylneuraminic acid synthetase